MKRSKRKKGEEERKVRRRRREREKKEMARSADSNHESSGLKSILVQEGKSGGTTPWNRRESTLRTFSSFLLQSFSLTLSGRKKRKRE